jgi:hypothetical protein
VAAAGGALLFVLVAESRYSFVSIHASARACTLTPEDANAGDHGRARTTPGKFSVPYEYRRENNGVLIDLTDR